MINIKTNKTYLSIFNINITGLSCHSRESGNLYKYLSRFRVKHGMIIYWKLSLWLHRDQVLPRNLSPCPKDKSWPD